LFRLVKSEIDSELAAIDYSPPHAPVHRVDPTTDATWDSDLASCPGATFFHTAAWARVLKGAYGYTPAYLETRSSRRFESLLPLMEVDSWITGRRGVSLPFTDQCAPICSDSESFERLYQEALSIARDRRWKYLECRAGLPLHRRAIPSVTHIGHRLTLDADESALFARCTSSTRRAVRKAEQSGLTVEFSRDLRAVRAFYKLFCRTRKRLGVPPQPFAFFASIHRHVLEKEMGWVVTASCQGTPIAGAIYFNFCKSAIYKFGASDENSLHLRGNNLVMWEAIKHYRRQGFEVLDFGRTSVKNEGLQKFKLSWGATTYNIDYVRHDLRRDAYVVATDVAESAHTHFLRLLPMPVFKQIGSVFYKHMT
jgi:hypothetical protein